MRRLSLVLLTLLSVACVRTRTNPVTGSVDVDVESPTKKGEDWKASIGGRGNYASVNGTANAAVLQGQSTITLALQGGTQGGSHPWMVHEGKCASTGGAAVGTPSLYPAISFGADGKATSTARLGVALDEAKDYHILIHKSADDLSTVVACGDLSDSA